MSKRPYLTAATMRPIFERYAQSDLTMKQFCALEKINIHTFQYWRRKFDREKVEADNGLPGFDQILPNNKIPFSTQVIVIRAGATVEMEIPLDYPTLQLVELIRGLSC